ncbi:hypothetical protein [Variovorax paradoxus]|jgi:hypothetical protein|uniref:hypothetical protein n=1 Tax=Variovorax paradoxus TaxID=34073 RepID=UPI0029C9A303|nr:hypothetical protein [Variovorax paradoxus]WPH19552.1 hypothetical protein RZE78_21300 [Variovorax paradoxus]
MRRILLSLIALAPLAALCSLPLQMTLSDMATEADHVLVGHVVGVDMVDGNGDAIADSHAQTGPDLTSVIRLRIVVAGTLVTTAAQVPKVLLLPLDPLMHYSLGQIKAAHEADSAQRLMLLKGVGFSPIQPGVFFRPLLDKDEVLRIHAAAHR